MLIDVALNLLSLLLLAVGVWLISSGDDIALEGDISGGGLVVVWGSVFVGLAFFFFFQANIAE